MSSFIGDVDSRTRLAGTNKLEILIFSLGVDPASGRRETFGINVFKVREVMRTPQITRAPEMAPGVQGMVNLRGELIPVIDLARCVHIEPPAAPEIMVATEYNGRIQGFLVEHVETILRVDWASMRVPPEAVVSQTAGKVTAVTQLEDGRLLMMLDVEKILSETGHQEDETQYHNLAQRDFTGHTVLYADDSAVARRQIERTLSALKLNFVAAVNGRDAWDRLERMAAEAQERGAPTNRVVQVVLTDIEMPEMDGYMLARRVKEDKRFRGIPVVMHSSLSGASNLQLGRAIGADDYVPKFEPRRLAEALVRVLGRDGKPVAA